jgi:hypothetical protein
VDCLIFTLEDSQEQSGKRGRSGRKMVNPPDILAPSRAVIPIEHIKSKNQANTPTMRVSIILHFEVNIRNCDIDLINRNKDLGLFIHSYNVFH